MAPESSEKALKDGESMPLVSIVTPVLNGAKYIDDSISSILNQNYDNIEQIIVDGGSNDGTLELITEYAEKYPGKIKLVSRPGQGVGEALNEGMRLAEGDILGEINADDKYEPGAISTVVRFFKANPDAVAVFGNCNIIDENNEVTGRFETKDFDLREIINKRNYIPQPSTFFKHLVLETIGLFEPSIGSDRDYWIRIGQVFPIHRIDNVLASFRIHGESATTGLSGSRRLIHLRADYLTTRKYGGSIFSPFCRRYYLAVIMEKLRPVIGFTYPWLRKIIKI